MVFSTGEYNHIEDVLCRMHEGPWYDWSDQNNKIYENLILYPVVDGEQVNYEKPSKSFLESELVRMEQERKDAIQADKDNKVSAKAKLEALGLATDEVKAAFGI